MLDLVFGGGIDVLLSARRVGPTGFAYGVDMTPEMLDLARANAARAGAQNVGFLHGQVGFLHGQIEAIPLPDAAVDVIIVNCVINLSPGKPAVRAEMFRVLTPGGRIGISDVVAEDDLSPAERAERGSHVGCIAGALSRSEYLDGLTVAGFTDPEVTFTLEVAPGMYGAIVRAGKPAQQPGRAALPPRLRPAAPRRKCWRRFQRRPADDVRVLGMRHLVSERPATPDGPVLARLCTLDRLLPVWVAPRWLAARSHRVDHRRAGAVHRHGADLERAGLR